MAVPKKKKSFGKAVFRRKYTKIQRWVTIFSHRYWSRRSFRNTLPPEIRRRKWTVWLWEDTEPIEWFRWCRDVPKKRDVYFEESPEDYF